jgi:hypothetical protein
MKIPVIMCAHMRPQLLKDTIRCLAAQTDQSFVFVIWDNTEGNWSVADHVGDPGFEFAIHGGGQNIGGIGRFFAAASLAGENDYVIFIDDDQIFNSDFVSTMKSEAHPNQISGWWAWRISGDNYFDRSRCPVNCDADYVGTGGMVVPTVVMLDHNLYSMLPAQYIKIEDLWLSRYFIGVHGGKLRRSKVSMKMIETGKYPDQWKQLGGRKREFYRYLKWLDSSGGWGPGSTSTYKSL